MKPKKDFRLIHSFLLNFINLIVVKVVNQEFEQNTLNLAQIQFMKITSTLHSHIFLNKKFSINLLISEETTYSTFLLSIPPSDLLSSETYKMRRIPCPEVSCQHEVIHYGLLGHFVVDAVWGRLASFSIRTFQSQFQIRT